MPRFTPRPMGLVGWLLITSFVAATAYLAAARPAVFLGALCGLAALGWLARRHNQRDTHHLLALASRREGQTICEFARDFDTRRVDTWILRAVYEQLQGQLAQRHPSFPVRADDRLKEDLLLDDDDLDMDLAPEVALRTGRSLHLTPPNPCAGKVRTVRDLVSFFQHQPQAGPAARA